MKTEQNKIFCLDDFNAAIGLGLTSEYWWRAVGILMSVVDKKLLIHLEQSNESFFVIYFCCKSKYLEMLNSELKNIHHARFTINTQVGESSRFSGWAAFRVACSLPGEKSSLLSEIHSEIDLPELVLNQELTYLKERKYNLSYSEENELEKNDRACSRLSNVMAYEL